MVTLLDGSFLIKRGYDYIDILELSFGYLVMVGYDHWFARNFDFHVGHLVLVIVEDHVCIPYKVLGEVLLEGTAAPVTFLPFRAYSTQQRVSLDGSRLSRSDLSTPHASGWIASTERDASS